VGLCSPPTPKLSLGLGISLVPDAAQPHGTTEHRHAPPTLTTISSGLLKQPDNQKSVRCPLWGGPAADWVLIGEGPDGTRGTCKLRAFVALALGCELTRPALQKVRVDRPMSPPSCQRYEGPKSRRLPRKQWCRVGSYRALRSDP
jgi:hypothetical protein